jgi:hypothetical protein
MEKSTNRDKIVRILKKMHPSESIALIESIGKELRRNNSIRISHNIPVSYIEMERPDLETLKQ